MLCCDAVCLVLCCAVLCDGVVLCFLCVVLRCVVCCDVLLCCVLRYAMWYFAVGFTLTLVHTLTLALTRTTPFFFNVQDPESSTKE